jgi:outer membrane receptor protein involved in Fe transport
LSPKFNFALNANYTFDLGGGYSGSANLSDVWVGERTEGYAGSAPNPLYKLPSYNTLNFNLAIVMPHNMEIDAYVKNIFDTEGQVSANTLNNALIPTADVPVYLSQPRTVGLVLKVGIGP